MESHGMKNANYKVINNVVDDIFFAKLASPSQHKVRIINVSSFDDAQKNLSGLLRVIHKLWLKRQDFEVYFVGAGVDFEYIFALAQQMGLENKVVYFTGLLSGSELVKQYQQSHFSVLFSKYENIPVVISESLVCGLPVVTTNAGGIAEHINNTNGILISINDEEALLSSLDYLIDHYSDYKKEELIQSAKEKYSYQYVGNQLFNIYSNILKK
jgi:glycosyltransferase involved in cell wall biosynthesis